MELAIRLDGLGHRYGAEDWLFRELSGVVRRGEVLAILGPNGRGKTTLLNILLGQLRPTQGTVAVDGSIGYVPQALSTPFPYSVLDMVLMGRARHVGLLRSPTRHDHAIAHAALDELGIAALAARAFTTLSGGQRQLVLFARALAAESELLILDEPSAALDLRNQKIILDHIAKLAARRGLSVVFTTHQPQHASSVADSALLLMPDASALWGPSREVLSEAALTRLYGIELRRVRVGGEDGGELGFVPVFGRR